MNVALSDALDRLSLAEGSKDPDKIWAALNEVLGWLYNLEELKKNSDYLYYEKRDADESGKTLAGLIWIRGLVVHMQAETRKIIFRNVTVRVRQEGEWKPATLRIKTDTGWKEPKVSVAEAVWPNRSDLPTSERPERNGRDEMYDLYVAGQRLLDPLVRAQSFLTENAAATG